MSDTVPMVPMVRMDGVNQTRPVLINLLRTLGDIKKYKSNITLTITLTSYHIVSRPLSDTQTSRIECTELVVDEFFPGLLSSAATLLPDQNVLGRRIAREITPVPGLFQDPATINLPLLLSSLTKTEVVEWPVSAGLPAECREAGNVLGCLLLQTSGDPYVCRFEPFDLSLWPVAVKFADEWLRENPVTWWQETVQRVRKVWVLTKSTPECRQGGAINQVYETCWIVSVLNLFARVPFLFLMLHEDLQEVVLASERMHSEGNNILRKGPSTRKQGGCPKLPPTFHTYMHGKHEDWNNITLNSGWLPKKLIQGMLEFSGNRYERNGSMRGLWSIVGKNTTIEYKFKLWPKKVEAQDPRPKTQDPEQGFLEWLTAQCRVYEAGLFSFQKQHEAHSHVVTLTMCQGQVIVCDYGVCVSITDWLKNQGLTVVLWAELFLYRRVKSKSKNAHANRSP